MLEERSNHEDCGDLKGRLYTRKVSGGYVSYCHNCGFREFIKDGITTPTQTIKNYLSTITLDDTQTTFYKDIQLPSDYSLSTIPSEGFAWLYKYGITKEEITRYGIGYSERYKRLILPVFDGETLLYWQGRNLKQATKDNPKYLNIRQSGAKHVYFRVLCNTVVPNRLVIVEDILSAIRCGRFYNSLALLGSYFPSELLNQFRDYEEILIFLDADKWKESVKAAKRFYTLTGKKFRVVYNEKDPKELNDETLQTILRS